MLNLVVVMKMMKWVGIIILAIMEYCDKTVEVVALHQHPQVVVVVGEILIEVRRMIAMDRIILRSCSTMCRDIKYERRVMFNIIYDYDIII